MIQNQALALFIVLMGGFLASMFVRRLHLPGVTGYVLFGLLLSPSLLGAFSQQLVLELALIKTLGLGLIALVIGGEMEIKQVRSLGRTIICSAVGLSAFTFAIVFSTMYIIARLPLPVSLILGVTATATAPAPPLTVIREMKARGPLTSTLLGLVATADALAIFAFGIISAIVSSIMSGANVLGTEFYSQAAWELLGSLILGLFSGAAISFLFTKYRDGNKRLVILLSIILFNSGIAQVAHFSPLLVNLVSGFIFANINPRPRQALAVLEHIETPLFIAFFTLAGSTLPLDILLANWQIALLYILARTFGILLGVGAGTTLSGAPSKVRRYLGPSVLSKAGVTIGLVLLVQGRFPAIAGIITAIELAAVTFFEIAGPVLTRLSLVFAGEAGESNG